MLQIVARAIDRPVLQVIAHVVRAIGNDAVRHAARQLSNQLQVFGRQNFVVIEIGCVRIELCAAIDLLANIQQRSFVHFGRTSQFSGVTFRIPNSLE